MKRLITLVAVLALAIAVPGMSTASAKTSTAEIAPDQLPAPISDFPDASPEVVDEVAMPGGVGFWSVTQYGQVDHEGGAPFYGDLSSINVDSPIESIAATSDGKGYWLLGADGGVFAFGDAQYLGSPRTVGLKASALQIIATSDSLGYWIVAADGGVFSYGDAGFYGSTGSIILNQPVVGMATTPSGKGYWLVAADGGIFSFGDANFFGSTGSITLNQPIDAMAATASGHGYWLLASDGGVFTFGDATFYGSPADSADSGFLGTFVGIEGTPDSGGYWLDDEEGGVQAYGDAVPAAPSPGPACSQAALTAAIPGVVSLAPTVIGQSFACAGDYAWVAVNFNTDSTAAENGVYLMQATADGWVQDKSFDACFDGGIAGAIYLGACIDSEYVLEYAQGH